MGESDSRTSFRTAIGVVAANAVLLGYGLVRPESLEFSIPFLIAPSLGLLGTAVALDKISKRHVLPAVWAIVGGLIVVILINELVS